MFQHVRHALSVTSGRPDHLDRYLEHLTMVAELTDIPVASAERKTPTAVPEKPRYPSRQKNRPKWIEAATREPIYSVLDSNEAASSSPPGGAGSNVVIISAVKSEKPRRGRPEDPRDEQRDLPYVWLPTQNKTTPQNSPTPDTEDEDPLYSVVRKPKRVELPETGALGRKLQPIVEQSTEEKQIQLEVRSRQEELKRWLQVASKQLPEPRRLFNLGEMYANRLGELDQLEADWKRNVAMPRGIVGLVGPYRVYQNPNERREYMLQEEELVEEVVDSVSEVAQRESNGEHHQRAKWRLREDDEDTLVPDIRDIPGLEDFTIAADSKETSEWKKLDDSAVEDSRDEEMSVTKEGELKGHASGVVSGREERPVDVPDEASTASIASLKDKKGETDSVPLLAWPLDRRALSIMGKSPGSLRRAV